MGQYHQFMNFDKKQILANSAPRKLTEWSYQGNTYLLQLEELMKTTWKGDNILCIGDYVDEFYDNSKHSALLNQIREDNKDLNTENIYFYPYKEINVKVKNKIPSRYIYNHAKKIFIDLKKQPIQWMGYDESKNIIYGTKFHPLSLLLSCSNGAGGGDYKSINYQSIGDWAYDSKKLELSDFPLNLNYVESYLVFDETESKKNNLEKLSDYIYNEFKKDDLEKIKNLKFDDELFLDSEEKKNIIESAIGKINNHLKSIQQSDIEIEM